MADKIKTILKKFKIWRSFKLRLLIIVFLMGIIPSIMTGILTVSISHILEESMTQKDIFMYAI